VGAMFKKKPFQDLDKIGSPLDIDKMRPVVQPRGGAERGDCEIWVPKDDRRSEAEPSAEPFNEEDGMNLG